MQHLSNLAIFADTCFCLHHSMTTLPYIDPLVFMTSKHITKQPFCINDTFCHHSNNLPFRITSISLLISFFDINDTLTLMPTFSFTRLGTFSPLILFHHANNIPFMISPFTSMTTICQQYPTLLLMEKLNARTAKGLIPIVDNI